MKIAEEIVKFQHLDEYIVSFYRKIILFFDYCSIMINGTKIGTNKDNVTPVINEITATFPSVAFEIIGSVVSIAVAPAGAILSNLPMYLAIRGIVIIAIISLDTFVINANVPS